MVRHRHPGTYKSKTKNGYIVYKRRPIHRLSKDKRKIFQQLDREDFETGGRMDFNLNGLERGDVWIGTSHGVDIPDDPDMEIDYHTHPRSKSKLKNKLNYFPSEDDLISLKETPSQLSLIFHEGNITTIGKMKNFKPTKTKIDKIENGLIKDAEKYSLDKLFKKYKPQYKQMGADINLIKSKGGVDLPFNVVEPVTQPKTTHKESLFFSDSYEDLTDEDLKLLQEEKERTRWSVEEYGKDIEL